MSSGRRTRSGPHVPVRVALPLLATQREGPGRILALALGICTLAIPITPPASEPTLVSSPSGSDHGFDWASAGVGAGAAMALLALGGAAFLTVHRRMAVSPSGTSMS